MHILKKYGSISRLTALLLCCLTLSFCLVTAGAEDTGTLTISYPLEKTVYHLYRVGSLTNGEIVMDNAFSSVNLSDRASAAAKIAKLVLQSGTQELASTKVTKGKAVFQNLPMGVYLVMGDPGAKDGIQYWPTPFLVSMPQKDDSGSLLWDVSVEGKREMNMSIFVRKRWVGDQAANRPTSVTVHLLRNGKAYGAPVILNENNQWSHTWKDLPPDEWSVVEDETPRYTTAITRDGNTFIVTNTWKTVPQTGQLWWPVSVLALGGLVLICIGLVRRRTSDENG